jgi:hypothetical protein
MRRAAFATTVVLVLVLAGVIADMAVPFANVGAGSYSASPRGEGLQADTSCKTLSGEACAGRLVYAPGRMLRAWFSVRNESPVAITLDGVPDAWFKQFAPEFLVRPVAALDGGDGARGTADLSGTPFRPVVLAPHAQRIVGVEFRTTSDIPYACAHWGRGIAVGWEWLPIEWHWAATRHEVKIVLPQPVEITAPTASNCAG